MDEKDLNIKEIFKKAFQNHQKKKFGIAENLYKEILKKETNHFEANYLLGSLLAQNKNFNLAKKLLKKANQIDPNHLSVLNNLGLVFYELGEFQLAIDC